jgi:hypothetical protein
MERHREVGAPRRDRYSRLQNVVNKPQTEKLPASRITARIQWFFRLTLFVRSIMSGHKYIVRIALRFDVARWMDLVHS